MFLKISEYSQENTCVSYRPGGMQFYWKETPIQMFSCEYWEIFKNTFFEKHLRTAASVLLIIKVVASIGHLFLIKNITRDDSKPFTKRFADLVRVYSLLIISRNHSNTFLLLDLQKNRIEVKYCNKGYLFWYHDFDRFIQVTVYYLMSILMIFN